MTAQKDRLINDLKVATNFLRSIDTGRAELDFELRELANRVEQILLEQKASKDGLYAGHKFVDAA